MKQKALTELKSGLDEFIAVKTKLLGKEMRDGDSRGMTWLKLRSPAAIFRTISGQI